MLSGALLIGGAAALWGTTGTARALGPEVASPISVGAWRIVLGGALLAALAAVTGGLPPVLRVGSASRLALLLGGIVIASYQLAFFSAAARTGVAVGTVVAIGSAPPLTALVSRLTGGPRIGRRWLAATGGAIAGCAILVLAGRSGGVEASGVGLALLAGGSYAVYAVISSRLIRGGLPERGVMGALFGIGALLLVPVAVLTDSAWLGTASGAAMTAWLAIATTVVAYLLYGRGLRLIPVSLAATIGLTEPAVAAVLGLLLLGEHLEPLALGGLLLLAASLVAAVLAPDPPRPSGAAAGRRLD